MILQTIPHFVLKKIESEYYLLSNEKPKVGDGVVERLTNGKGMLMTIFNENDLDVANQRKIIASTRKDVDFLPPLSASYWPARLPQVATNIYTVEDMRGFTKWLMKWHKPVKGGWRHRGAFSDKTKPVLIEALMNEYIQILANEKSEPEWKVEIELELDGPIVVSGGFRTGDEDQPPGLQHHENYKPRLSKEGFVMITKIL